MYKQPEFAPLPLVDKYLLLEDFYERVNGMDITIPAGFIFDGASIPRLAWGITYPPFHPKVMKSALFHDYLYFNHQCDRDVADMVFLTLLMQATVPEFKANAMYHAVATFGGGSWEWTHDDAIREISLFRQHKDSESFDDFQIPNVSLPC